MAWVIPHLNGSFSSSPSGMMMWCRTEQFIGIGNHDHVSSPLYVILGDVPNLHVVACVLMVGYDGKKHRCGRGDVWRYTTWPKTHY
jgi:hypothetical protein